MRRRLQNSIFHDNCAVPLSRSQAGLGARQARRAALEAQGSLTLTAKKQYRRYRAQAGQVFLDWPVWHAHYVRAYRKKTLDIATKNQWGGMPPGSFGGSW